MGASYGGALGLMLAGADRRVDGVVSAITWNDLADAFFPQAAVTTPATTAAGRAPVDVAGPFKQVWATNFFLSALRGSSRPGRAGAGAARCGRFDPTICRLFVQASETGAASPQLTALLRAHSPKPTMNAVTAPTFLVQGVGDSLFGLDQADATASALAAAGTPYAVRWSDGGHDAASTHETEELEASYTWLDHYVRDKASASRSESALPTAAFTYGIPASRAGQPTTLHTLTAYPGLSGATLRTRELPLATIVRLAAAPARRTAGLAHRRARPRGARGQPLDLPDRGAAGSVDGSRHPADRRGHHGRRVAHDASHRHLGRTRRHALRLRVARHRGLGDADEPARRPGPAHRHAGPPDARDDLAPGGDLRPACRHPLARAADEHRVDLLQLAHPERHPDLRRLGADASRRSRCRGRRGRGRRRRHRDAHRAVSARPAAPRRGRRVVRPPSSPHAPAGAPRPRRHPARRRGARQDVCRRAPRRRRRVVARREGPGRRAARPQRRRQDDDDAHGHGPHLLRRRQRPRARRAGLGRFARCSAGSAPSSRAPASCRTSPGARTSRPTGPPRAGRPRTPTSTRPSTSPPSAAPSTGRSSPTATA